MTTGPSDPEPPLPAPGWHIDGEDAPPQTPTWLAPPEIPYPPAPPPPVVPTTGWVLPSDGQPLRWPGIGTVIRRTATVVAGAPRTFLALALLGAIPGIVRVAIPQPTALVDLNLGWLI